MRYSKQREMLIDTLKSTRSHPDAEWLYFELKKTQPNISLVTVYRNLRQLAQNGEILELICDGSSHFDGFTNLHYHMHCDKCKKIYDLSKNCVDIKVNEPNNFKINGYNLIFNGVCSDCQGRIIK